MSPMIAVIILIGITVAMGGVLAYVFMGQTDTLTQSDSVTPSSISLIKVGSTSFVSANVKNTGNADVNNLEIIVEVDTNTGSPGIQPFSIDFSPSTIRPGQTATVNAKIVDNVNAVISMTSGIQYLVSVNGTTADGGNISYPTAVRVR